MSHSSQLLLQFSQLSFYSNFPSGQLQYGGSTTLSSAHKIQLSLVPTQVLHFDLQF